MVVVTIFTKEGCAESEAMRLDLTSCQIPFQEIVLEPHDSQQVPEVYFDNDPVVGGVDELLNILQKWEVVTGKDGLPDIVPIKSGQHEIDEYYQSASIVINEKERVVEGSSSEYLMLSTSRESDIQYADDGCANPRNSKNGGHSNQQRLDPQNHEHEANRQGRSSQNRTPHNHSRNRDNRSLDGRSSLLQRHETAFHDENQSHYDCGPNGGHSQFRSHGLKHPREHSYQNGDFYHHRHGYSCDPYQQHHNQIHGQLSQHDRRQSQHHHRENFPGEHQDYYRQTSQHRQQRDRPMLKGHNPSFLEQPNRRSGLRGEEYQRHSFHGRTLHEAYEADYATISSPNRDDGDDSTIASQQSFLQESVTQWGRGQREKSRVYISSKPRSFHGYGNRRQFMAREHSFHGSTRHKDFEFNDAPSVTNPNDDDFSVCSRQSYSSRHSTASTAGRGSITTARNTSPPVVGEVRRPGGMKRELSLKASSLRDEMKREASMRGTASLHGSSGSLYGSLNELSDDESEISYHDDTNPCSDKSSTHKNPKHSERRNDELSEPDDDLSLSPEEVHDVRATEDNVTMSRSGPAYQRASSVKHMNPRNYEREFMRSLNNINSRSYSNLEKPESQLSSYDGHASSTAVRRDLRGARSHSPMMSTGRTRDGRRPNGRDIGNARSSSPAASTARPPQLKLPTPMPRQQQQLPLQMAREPSLRSAAMRVAAGRESFSNSTTSMWSNTTGRKEEYEHVVELPKGRVLSIKEATLELLKILPRNDLKYNLTTYQKSFTGTVATETFKEVYNLSREEAEDLGKVLGQAKFLHHVCWDHKFKDTPGYFYRLQCEQTPEILNSFCLWQDEKTLTKQVKEVMSNIQGKLQLVLDQITDHAKGRIHYSHITKMHEELVVDLDYALCELQFVKLARMDKKHLLAFGLNVFQVFLHYAFIKVGIPTSSLGRAAFWTELKFDIGGDVYTFSDWWDGICRGNRKGLFGPPPFKGTDGRKFLNLPNPVDPRIHFAAGMSNFMRPMFFYSGENLDLELEHAARAYCRKERLVSLNQTAMTLEIPGGFQAYLSDFAQHTRAIPKLFMQWLPGKSRAFIDEALTIGKKIKVVYGISGVKCDDWNEYAGDYVIFEKAPFADFKRNLLLVNQKKPEVPKREIKRKGSLKNLLALVSSGDTETGESKEQV